MTYFMPGERNANEMFSCYMEGVDYVKGANIAGFIKVADAMLAYGHV